MASRNFFDPRDFDADEIVPGLYLGSWTAACSLDELKKRKISHIISVIDNEEPKFKKKAEDAADWNLIDSFELCITFIDEALKKKGAILVHCGAGISRSSTIVVAYVMKTYQKSFKDALAMVREKRPWASPNGGFQKQLTLFEEQGCKLDKSDTKYQQLVAKLEKPVVERWHKGKKSVVEC